MLSLNRAGGVNATRDDVILFAFSGHSQLRRLPVLPCPRLYLEPTTGVLHRGRSSKLS
jgi:hypothetical protein